MAPELTATEERLLRFVENREGSLPSLLYDICRYQARWNPVLRRWWQRHGFDPLEATRSAVTPSEVPAVPTDVFRSQRLVSNEAPATRVFRTSGTTSGTRGEHWRISTRPYAAGAVRHLFHSIPEVSRISHFVPLVFSPEEVPDSSLSYMAHVFASSEHFDASGWFLDPQSGPRIDQLEECLSSIAPHPVFILGTAFAFVMLADKGFKTSLPAGSIIVETGGYKGRTRTLELSQLRNLIHETLGVPEHDIRTEYSMTELSSQLYTSGRLGSEHTLRPPPWCMVQASDPQSLRVLPPGCRGLLRFVDLANTDSVVAVQTSDIGTVCRNGEVILEGRAAASQTRGCSLAVEEIQMLVARQGKEPSNA